MKNIILLILITFLSSCVSKKIVTENRPIKFIPNSSELKFELSKKQKMPFPSYDFGAEIYKGEIYCFLATEDYFVDWDKSYGKVCKYNIKNDKWTIINIIPKYQSYTSSVIIKNKIYLIGSYKFKNYIQVYNILNNKWEEEIIMPIGLYWSAVESYKEKIYVIGGYAEGIGGKGTRRLNTIQIYDTKTKEWKFGNSMPIKSHSLNSLKFNNNIYVWNNFPRRFMLKYNIREDVWEEIEKLNPFVKASQEGIIYNNNFLFFSGQKGRGLKSKASKKIYLYKKNKYIESEDSLITGRHYDYNIFQFDKKIYILGGREDQNWKAMNDVIEIKIKN